MKQSTFHSDSDWNEDILKAITADEEVLILAGHSTPRVRPVRLEEILPTEDGEQLLLVDVEVSAPSPKTELLRITRGESGRAWAVIRPERPALEDLARMTTDEILSVSFRPSRGELGTWESACRLWRELHDQGRVASLGTLVGDFQIPVAARKALLPYCFSASYVDLLHACGASREALVFLSEASARNQGKRYLFDTPKRSLRDHGTAKQSYQESGYGVFHDPTQRTYFLASDKTLEFEEPPHMVCLTQNKSRPSCGLIVAGSFLDVIARGFTHLVSIYDRQDDVMVRRKHLDGATIIGHLGKEEDWSAHFVTIDHGRPQDFSVDLFSTRSFSAPGRLDDYDALLLEARRRTLLPALEPLHEFEER